MLVTRCLSGALNGNVAVVRAAVWVFKSVNVTKSSPILTRQCISQRRHHRRDQFDGSVRHLRFSMDGGIDHWEFKSVHHFVIDEISPLTISFFPSRTSRRLSITSCRADTKAFSQRRCPRSFPFLVALLSDHLRHALRVALYVLLPEGGDSLLELLGGGPHADVLGVAFRVIKASYGVAHGKLWVDQMRLLTKLLQVATPIPSWKRMTTISMPTIERW